MSLLVSFLLIVIFGGCCKDESEPEDKYLIRVKNTSAFNYLNVRVIPVPPGYFQFSGKLGVGEVSEYLPFDKAYTKIDAEVQYDESNKFGIIHPHDQNETDLLAPGKYLIEVKLVRDPDFRVETKMIRE